MISVQLLSNVFFSVMDLKYGSLLLNVPTRHTIQRIQEDFDDQMTKLLNNDLNNFFLLGTSETMDRIMSLADKRRLIGTKAKKFVFPS